MINIVRQIFINITSFLQRPWSLEIGIRSGVVQLSSTGEENSADFLTEDLKADFIQSRKYLRNEFGAFHGGKVDILNSILEIAIQFRLDNQASSHFLRRPSSDVSCRPYNKGIHITIKLTNMEQFIKPRRVSNPSFAAQRVIRYKI